MGSLLLIYSEDPDEVDANSFCVDSYVGSSPEWHLASTSGSRLHQNSEQSAASVAGFLLFVSDSDGPSFLFLYTWK
jgi:hypothetical protein